MSELYTRQALPSRYYRELLGSALCVFNSNNAFVIENILKHDINEEYSQVELFNKTSGELSQPIKETITKHSNSKITRLFSEVIDMRNRIIHSYQITNSKNEQVLATVTKKGEKFEITDNYLYDFLIKNEKLSDMLHDFRGH